MEGARKRNWVGMLASESVSHLEKDIGGFYIPRYEIVIWAWMEADFPT